MSNPGRPVPTGHTPPGWPPGVPPENTPGWEDLAVLWLLDQCPPDYSAYAGWRRHPVALAWLTGRHVDGQVVAMREAWREARVAIGPHVPAEALTEILGQIEAEGIRLMAASRSVKLLHEALQGKVFAPRL